MTFSNKRYFLALGATVIMMAFQNCSDVQFQSSLPDGSNKTTENDTLVVGDPIPTEENDDVVCVTEPCNETPVCNGKDCTPNCLDNDMECPVVTVPDVPKVPTDNDDGNENFACSPGAIQDIFVNINRVEVDGKIVSSATGKKSLIELSSALVVINSTGQLLKGNTIRIVLNDSGNSLVDSLMNSFELKTPSAQQSGLKVLITGNNRQNLQPNRVYKIGFDLDVNTQIVQNKKKCLLKPVLHNGHIAEFET